MMKSNTIDASKNVRYLYAPGELEGVQSRATHSVWSMEVYNVERLVVNEDEPFLYYLNDGLKHGFVREELKLIPPGTELTPEEVH